MYTFTLNKNTYIINITEAKKLTEGNEGIIYDLNDRLLFKLYKKHDPLKIGKVQEMVRYLVSHPRSCVLKYSSWPIALVYDENFNQVGYIMKKFDGKLLDVLGGLHRSHKTFPSFKTSDLFDVSINLIEALENMRRELKDFIIGDFSAMNVLVNEHKEICFIDMDSICFNGYPCKVATKGYKAYETIVSSPSHLVFTSKTDDFLVALITFSVISGCHPYSNNAGKSYENCIKSNICALFDDQYKMYRPTLDYTYKNLFTKDLLDLYKEFFVDGCIYPQKRPSISILKQKLAENKNTFRQCRKDKRHQYSKNKCPYCHSVQMKKKKSVKQSIHFDKNSHIHAYCLAIYILLLILMCIGMMYLYAVDGLKTYLFLLPIIMLVYAGVTLSYIENYLSVVGCTCLSFWCVGLVYEFVCSMM